MVVVVVVPSSSYGAEVSVLDVSVEAGVVDYDEEDDVVLGAGVVEDASDDVVFVSVVVVVD